MRRPSVISLYTGAGGLDWGFERAGFETRVAVEVNEDACLTLRHNRPRLPLIQDSIHNVSSSEILECAGLRRGEVDVVIGGPPCQPFSKSSYWVSGDSPRLLDPRTDTLAAYMRVVEDVLPGAFLLENVGAINFSGKSEGVMLLMSLVDDINRRQGVKYSAHAQVMKATDFGVPQKRDRFIMVAQRDGAEFRFPSPTHGAKEGIQGLEPYMRAWDVLHDVRVDELEAMCLRARGKWADLLPSIMEGYNYSWHTNRGPGKPIFGWRKHYWNFLLKLAKDQPAWTITAQPGPATGPFHWHSRKLSRREMCRLQTFPDDIDVLGTHSSAQRQIGNAVPSLLAEVIAREMMTQLQGRSVKARYPSLLSSRQVSVPPPEKISRVPAKYMSMVGEHEDHPGTGRGNRAKARL